MDTIIEDKDALFTTVFSHLTTVQENPTSTTLDPDLLKRAERAIDASTPQPLLWRLLSTGETILQSLQEDPRPLTRLLERTIHFIPFDDLKSVISPAKLIEGLISPAPPIQILCLAYVLKAADSPSGAAYVAASAELSRTLVRVWLSSLSTEVADRCCEVVIALLAVDSPGTVTFVGSRTGGAGAVGQAEGQGLMWRRLFHDVETYELLLAWTSMVQSEHDLSTRDGQRNVTLSQGRLFDFVVKVATLDWSAITTTIHGEVDRLYSSTGSGGGTGRVIGGFLRYTGYGMIDDNDYLMKVLRQDFFAKLLEVAENENTKGVTPRLIVAFQDGAGVQRPDPPQTNGIHL